MGVFTANALPKSEQNILLKPLNWGSEVENFLPFLNSESLPRKHYGIWGRGDLNLENSF